MFVNRSPSNVRSSVVAHAQAVPGLGRPGRTASKSVAVFALVSFISLFLQDATAQITEIRVDQSDNAAGGTPLDGFVTNDVSISFDGRYTGSQLLVLLDQGSIYQDPDGDIVTPEFTSPSAEFDSFVAQGLPTIGVIDYDQSDGDILGAVDLGGAHPGTFDAQLLNIAWHPLPPIDGTNGQFLEDLSDLLTARISLSDDAVGSWAYLASAELEIQTESRIIQDGVIQYGALLLPSTVPEPATWSLGGLVALAGLTYVRWTKR